METKLTDTQDIENKIKEIFEYIGEDPEREGLKDTPSRIIRMWKEVLRGYNKNLLPKITTFNNGTDGIYYDQMIIDSGDYYSFCEHHFMPFFGKYWFGYIPETTGLVLGLSKVARAVDYFSSKLQIQERLTGEIVDYLWKSLCNEETKPKGMILVMEGEHLCKTMRGAKKKGKMKTSYFRGVYSQQETREEFLSLIKEM